MRYSNLLRNATEYASAFKTVDITTPEMKLAIQNWFELYYRDEPSKTEDPCQQIPYTIVRKLTKTVFSEYHATAAKPFAEEIMKSLDSVAAAAMQLALIGGEVLLKPILKQNGAGFYFVPVPRNNILVFARDAWGNMTDIGTMEQTASGNRYHTLLERRTVNAGGYLTIRYKLMESLNKEALGKEIPLNSVPQYAQLKPEYTFASPVRSIGMVSMKTPMVNCVDGSADGVSVYAAAAGLIQNINRNEALLNGEFEKAQSRIVVSDDVIVRDKYGNVKVKDDIFVGIDGETEDIGFNIFSPTIREASFLARKQEYLRNVENVIGLKRGLLSEVEAAERTATEITSSAGEYNLTIIDFQKMWETAVRDALRLCGVLGQLYQVAGANVADDKDVVFNWGNGVLYDEAKTYAELKEQVSMGLLQPERLVGWYHNLPCETPEDREKIRKNYMPDNIEEDIE